MNIAHNIERACRHFPHKTALTFEERRYTYRSLHDLVNQFANVLTGMKIKSGDRVALFLPNIPEFAIAYLAAQKVGAIAVSVNAMLKQDEVQFILADSSAVAVVTTGELRAMISSDRLPLLRHIFIAEGEQRNDLDMYALMGKASTRARAQNLHPETPAAIVYTSGTTGFPKGAVLSHGNVLSNAYAKVHYCGMKPTDRMQLFLPLFHCFGQNAILNSAFLACATVVLQRRFVPEQALAAITEQAVTMFFGVPALFIRLLHMTPHSYDFSSIRYFFSAAATLPEEIARRWHELYRHYIYIGYGLTETSPFASYNHDLCYKFGSVGTPIENVEMKVMSLDGGKEVEPGTPGEIVIRGPNVMLSYWQRPEETAQAIRDGWFYSGDIGTMDEDGYFYVVDRLKDMINVSGFKVYPAEVENVLYKHPAVAETAVYGLPDAIRGETVNAQVILKEGHETVREEDLITFCRENMAVYKAPHKMQFVQTIPQNGAGKILKRVIRDKEIK